MSASDEITLQGHLIDSAILPRVMDEIVASGGSFRFLEFNIGTSQEDPSFCRIEVTCADDTQLAKTLSLIAHHGAVVESTADAEIIVVDHDGVFPTAFYSTTNQRTAVRHEGHWLDVCNQEMDCAIRRVGNAFECVAVSNVKAGDEVVCGYHGIKVEPQQRERNPNMFEFMSSAVSSERPKHALIREVASRMREVRESGKRILLVGGPAIVHTGAGRHVVQLIEDGYINLLFAGNALATHDIEQSLHGTSLGMHVDKAVPIDSGHEHHIRSINTIRQCGSIAEAVDQGVLTSGIMHRCVTQGIDFVLAGSIRDDGPLPDVITDVLAAQDRMRDFVGEIGFVLIVATALHGIATGNILPAWIPMVCVDIEAAVVTKLADRGSWQTVGIVTDVEPFFHELLEQLRVQR
jgi:lysine-ketoglutarate reductase/saccharopine dehydrogenase-like protein (TIGR00300 family)